MEFRNGGPQLLDPGFQQQLEDSREQLKREIQRELKIKEGAENLRKVSTDKKHQSHVESQLKTSNRRLQELHHQLQDLNGRIVIMEKDAKAGIGGGLWVNGGLYTVPLPTYPSENARCLAVGLILASVL